MPWIRITVILKTKTLRNIRQVEVGNIDILQNTYYKKSQDHYRSEFQNCEVAILSKNSGAVIEFQDRERVKYLKSKEPKGMSLPVSEGKRAQNALSNK